MQPTAAVAAITAAQRLLQRRALQCSFTSVFHLRQSGLMGPQEATQVERLFLVSAGLPLLILLVSGATLRWRNATTTTTTTSPSKQVIDAA